MTSYASFDSGNIRVVEKAMEEAFPHVQLRLDPALDEVRVRIQRGAQFEAARAGNDQRWREACEGFRRVETHERRRSPYPAALLGRSLRYGAMKPGTPLLPPPPPRGAVMALR